MAPKERPNRTSVQRLLNVECADLTTAGIRHAVERKASRRLDLRTTTLTRLSTDGAVVRLGDKETALCLCRGGCPIPFRQIICRQKGARLLLEIGGAHRLEPGHNGGILWKEPQID